MGELYIFKLVLHTFSISAQSLTKVGCRLCAGGTGGGGRRVCGRLYVIQLAPQFHI